MVRLNEENVSLKRELEKLGVTSGKTPDRRVTRKSKNKDKEKSMRHLQISFRSIGFHKQNSKVNKNALLSGIACGLAFQKLH